MRTKKLWIKDEYLQLILDGRKTVEIRVGYENIKRLRTSDQLLLNDSYRYAITRINQYYSFEEMLQHENPALIAPDTPPDELIDQIRTIYPQEKEDLGVIALEIKPLRGLRVHIQYEYKPDLITYLESMLNPGVTVSVGDLDESAADFQVLVAGRPQRADIEASSALTTLIIPWAGLPPETRELASEYPAIAVHNLHHNAVPVAELAVALMLAAGKSIIAYDKGLRRHDWTMRYNPPHRSLLFAGLTALILGYGQIGQHVARICSALGMNVLAMKRHPAPFSDQYTAEIHPPDHLEELLPRANALIICLPLTPQTDNLIGEHELALLPPASVLINIGRGDIVNEAALYHALHDGRLYAAGLDVWYNYPQEKSSRSHTPASNYPFHELENVVMSPHRAGDTVETDRLRMVHLAKLLNAIDENKPVPNKIDTNAGY